MAILTIKINDAYKEQRMSFEKVEGKTLKDLTNQELTSLAIMARKSGNPILMRCFTPELPKLKALVDQKVEMEQLQISDNSEIAEKPTVVDVKKP